MCVGLGIAGKAMSSYGLGGPDGSAADGGICMSANSRTWNCNVLRLSLGHMLTINITWEYYLGIFGTLIALAYYANGRFTRIETNFNWLADTVRDLSVRVENIAAKAFDIGSPISLTSTRAGPGNLNKTIGGISA